MNQKKIDESFRFYHDAKYFVMDTEFRKEVEHVQQLDFNKTTANDFMSQFCFVVLNTGMKNQVAQKMFDKLVDSGWNPETINHEGKRNAVIKAINNYTVWFDELKAIKTTTTMRSRIEFLQTLPFIGKITKYHLARNIGLDCAKPDRHLVLLAKKFEYDTPRGMCEMIAQRFDEKVGVIDVILWRYCDLNPDVVKEMKQEVLT